MVRLKKLLIYVRDHLRSESYENTLIEIVNNYNPDTQISLIKGYFSSRVLIKLTELGLEFVYKTTHTQYYDKDEVSYVVKGIVSLDSLTVDPVDKVGSTIVFIPNRMTSDVYDILEVTSGDVLINPLASCRNLKVIKPLHLRALISKLEELVGCE